MWHRITAMTWRLFHINKGILPGFIRWSISRRINHFISSKTMSSPSSHLVYAVHSDQPENQRHEKIRQCSGENRIKHAERQKSGNTARIKGGILWVEIIPLMDLTQFGRKEQYSLPQDWHGLQNSHGGFTIQRIQSWFESIRSVF